MSFAAIGRIAGGLLRSGTTFSRAGAAGFAASGTLSTSSARAVGKAAEEASFFQGADQPVDARFRLEAERLLHLLERRRNAARVEALLDEVEQFMLLRGQHRSFSMMTRRCRSEEHTSELQSLMRISYAVFCLKQ